MSTSALRSRTLWVVVATLVALDWGSKWAAEHWLIERTPFPSRAFPRLLLVHNAYLNWGVQIPGASRLLYTLLGLAALALITRLGVSIPGTAKRYVVAFAFMFAGGIGNVLEKTARGSATDFIDFGHGSFNVADIVGVVGGLLYLIMRTRDAAREEGWRYMLTAPPQWRDVVPPSMREQPNRDVTARSDSA